MSTRNRIIPNEIGERFNCGLEKERQRLRNGPNIYLRSTNTRRSVQSSCAVIHAALYANPSNALKHPRHPFVNSAGDFVGNGV
jgi:hypothetical protein